MVMEIGLPLMLHIDALICYGTATDNIDQAIGDRFTALFVRRGDCGSEKPRQGIMDESF